MKMNELSAKLGISRSKIYEMLNPKSPRYDPSLAREINLPGRKGFMERPSAQLPTIWVSEKPLDMECDMQHKETKIIRIKQLIDKLGFCRSKIYEMSNPKSSRYDPSFPKPIKLGRHAIGWIESSIDEWLRNKEE